MKTTVEYIVFNFKNTVSNDYKNRIIFISSKLKNVELKRKSERLIENVSKIILFENEYISNSNIRSISLLNKKIITSLKKSLINVFNTFTPSFRIARFILFLQRHSFTLFSKFVQSIVCFLNLSSQSVSKIIEKLTKEVLHAELKSFLTEKEILSSQKIVVDDRF